MGALLGYSAWMLTLTTAYFALPGLSVAFLCLLSASAAGVIVVRVARCRPAQKLPWLLLAAAVVCFGGSRLTLLVGAERPQIPSWDAYTIVGLPTYALLAVALALFARARSSGPDRRSLVDAVTVSAGLVLLVWLFRILPTLTDPALTGAQKLASACYPVGQIAILLALARLLAPGIVWDWPVRLVTIGTVCGLVSGVVFGLLRLQLAYWRLLDFGWIACFALCGAAALHPAMREMTRHAARPYETSRARLIVLTVASFVAPLLLILQGHDDPRDAVIAVSAALVWLLAQARLWGLNVSQLRTLTWERALTAAGPALASAASVEEVAAALRTAAETVTGPRSGQAAVFATRIGGQLPVLMMSSAGRRRNCLAATAPRWLPSVLPLLAGRTEADRPTPLYVPAAELESSAGTGDLGSGGDGVLLCPIFLSTDQPGDPPAGLLALIGGQRNLEVRWPSVRILVSEAGLAMERILLTQERVKRESEELFKELVHDASDAILIIDDDDTVRYASPSASAIYGDVPIVGTDVRRLHGRRGRGMEPREPGCRRSGRVAERFQRAVADHPPRRADHARTGQAQRLAGQAKRPGQGADAPRRHRGEAPAGRVASPCLPRCADRTAEPGPVRRPRRASAGTGAADRHGCRGPVHRPRRLQGRQRHARARDGRRAAYRVRAPPGHDRQGIRCRRADRGDEFALLIDNLRDPAEADAFAERAMAAFSERFVLSEGPVTMTATVGVATSDGSDSAEEMTRHADLALYAAKAAGKHGWQRYSPALSSRMARRLEIRSALEQAVSDSTFVLAYQPIVSLDTGHIAGFEALVRWPRPDRDTLMPDQFIDVAEDTGLIVPLGAWVVQRALSDLAAGRASGSQTADPFVSVNVSARQFGSATFVTTVRRALEDAGLPPSLLLLELTESVLLRQEEGIAANLAELQRLGVRLAIDDFGTGYSSLSYLRELPIDVLKIDRSFVEGITASQRRLALAKGIVGIASTLGIAVVAEGIETREQCELVTEMGCEYGQGYLLARPMPWQDGQRLLRTNRPLTPPRPSTRDRPPGSGGTAGGADQTAPWPPPRPAMA